MSKGMATGREEQADGGPSLAGALKPEALSRPAKPVPVPVDAAGRPRWWRDALRRRMLAAADLVAAMAGSLVAATTDAELLWSLAFLPAWLLIAKLLGLYDRDHRAIRHLTIDELPGLCAWALSGTVALVAFLSLMPVNEPSEADILKAFAIVLVVGIALRSATRALWRKLTAAERCLVIGGGGAAERIERKLSLFPDMHLEPAGKADPEVVTAAARADPTGEDGLGTMLSDVDRVVIAAESLRGEVIADLSNVCRSRQVKLSVVSSLSGRSIPALRITQVADLPVFEFNTWDVSRSTMALKRGFDLVGAGFALLLTAPLWPLLALLIKLDSRGPVLFPQLRAGRVGKPFRMLKFRTMHEGAAERLDQVVPIDQLDRPAFKLADDPRRTRVGTVLRRLSLDELPQLLNVIRGDMSIVGPRPEQVELVDRYGAEDRFRLDVKPGLTGPMQVSGRGDLSFDERLAVELDYVENLSLARDLRILAMTIPAVFRRHGAY